MAVTEEMVVTIVEAEVTDSYLVELHTPESVKHRTVLTPEQARRLATELHKAAAVAQRTKREDDADRLVRMVPASFDIDGPLNPECREGKCRNCSGDTLDGSDAWVRCTHHCHTERAA